MQHGLQEQTKENQPIMPDERSLFLAQVDRRDSKLKLGPVWQWRLSNVLVAAEGSKLVLDSLLSRNWDYHEHYS